jgi:signal transduction histidine kinase
VRAAELDIRAGRVVAGIVFAAIGLGFLFESYGAWKVEAGYVWPVALIAIGVSFLLGRAKRIRIDEDRNAKLAVAEERVRIARELHDIVAHGVSLMTIQIAAARRVAQTKPDAANEALAAAEEAGRQSLAELRSLLAVLRSADASIGEVRFGPTTADGPADAGAGDGTEPAAPTTPLPRLSDVPDLVEALRSAGLDVRLEQDGLVPVMSPAAELTVYRVVQESLTNVVRHAPGARVSVKLTYAPDGVSVIVEDNGAGVMIPGSAPEGHGLTGMRERVTAGGGRLQAGPRTDAPGWRVIASIPASAAARS